jgi:formate/nitrite transporter FocA (FNT family)
MYFIPAGIFSKQLQFAVTASGIDAALLTKLNWAGMWHSNLIAVTLGNFIGGGFFVGVIYWLVYLRKGNPR